MMLEKRLEGVLPVLKPVDYTSHDVVAKVRRMIGIKRIGHTGTLDPKVTGVLLLCIGKATRVAEYLQDLPKTYETELTIGLATDTEDLSGKVIERADKVRLTLPEIEKAVYSFVGAIEQVPPMYSAVKVEGKRLYELARLGKEVERVQRKATVYGIDILDMNLDIPYPKVRFKVRCSKGTYIRTLCADIGKALGYPSVMSSLVRTSTGDINIEQCLSLETIEQLYASGKLEQYVIPIDRAISHIPSLEIAQAQVIPALQGQQVDLSFCSGTVRNDSDLYRIYSPEGTFLGIYNTDREANRLKPIKVFQTYGL